MHENVALRVSTIAIIYGIQAANGEEDEVESTPSKGRKRARVTQQANK